MQTHTHVYIFLILCFGRKRTNYCYTKWTEKDIYHVQLKKKTRILNVTYYCVPSNSFQKPWILMGLYLETVYKGNNYSLKTKSRTLYRTGMLTRSRGNRAFIYPCIHTGKVKVRMWVSATRENLSMLTAQTVTASLRDVRKEPIVYSIC